MMGAAIRRVHSGLGMGYQRCSEYKLESTIAKESMSTAIVEQMERSLLTLAATLVTLFYMTICVGRVVADVGTATSYDPPYLPTRCPGYDQDQLPGTGLFVAAGHGVWDNGAACGRKYQVRCLSGLRRPCKDGSIVVEVVDLCRTNSCTSTLVLSDEAFSALSKIPNTKINIEYRQL